MPIVAQVTSFYAGNGEHLIDNENGWMVRLELFLILLHFAECTQLHTNTSKYKVNFKELSVYFELPKSKY